MNGQNNNLRNIVVWIIIGLLVLALINLFSPVTQQTASTDAIDISQVYDLADQQKITDVTIAGTKVTGKFIDGGKEFTSTVSKDAIQTLDQRLTQNKVKFGYKDAESDTPTLFAVLVNWFPILLLVGVWIFFMRQHSRSRLSGARSSMPQPIQ